MAQKYSFFEIIKTNIRRINKRKIFAFASVFLISTVLILLCIFSICSKFYTDSNSVNINEEVSNYDIPNYNNRVYTYLILGEDEAANLTDVIILASVNINNGDINILQVPRDTYAEYTTNAYRKINGAKVVLNSAKGVADFLSENLNIDIDFYVTLNLKAVEKIVDEIGGIEVNVPIDMKYSDPYQNLYITINKGRQILDGKNAVKFIRYRQGYLRGDLGRIDAQKIFLVSFMKTVKDKLNPVKLVKIVSNVMQYVDSNISKENLYTLIKLLPRLDLSKVYFMTLPGGDIRGSSGAWYYVINKMEVAKMLSQYFVISNSEILIDPRKKFTSDVRKGFDNIYNAISGYDAKVYSALDIYNKGLDIK